jgi:hypothetical protein
MKKKFITIKIGLQTKRLYLDDVKKIYKRVIIKKYPKIPKFDDI